MLQLKALQLRINWQIKYHKIIIVQKNKIKITLLRIKIRFKIFSIVMLKLIKLPKIIIRVKNKINNKEITFRIS